MAFGKGRLRVPADLTPEENAEWSKLKGGLSQIDTEPLRSVSLQEWAARHVRHERVRHFFYAMCRQWSYCDEMSELSDTGQCLQKCVFSLFLITPVRTAN
ncbi:hypothetical protein [Paenibacillus fonticola]|uniref:hypothetical protein n=1 Tax=Paenibacillus fonticola TaxID=379896 RepID=UPI0003A99FC3|nr:hypothetical protein [Paenibacillus fonticola]